jgi:putative Holliday junction resolvase
MRDQGVVGFDYGTKRIGVAVGQTVTGTASPVATLKSRAGRPDWAAIRAIIEGYAPEVLVVGVPIAGDGPGDAAPGPHPLGAAITRFANQLRGRFRLPVHTVDERLSSHEARSRAPRDGHIDAVAAQVILETWLDAAGLDTVGLDAAGPDAAA